MFSIDSQEPGGKKRLWSVTRIKVFLAEVLQELKMVSFPTWREVRSTTAIVLIVIFILGAYIFLVDQLCERYLDPLMFRRR